MKVDLLKIGVYFEHVALILKILFPVRGFNTGTQSVCLNSSAV